MGPSRKPGQDCQVEQALASTFRIRVNYNPWDRIYTASAYLNTQNMIETCLKNSMANELHSPAKQLSYQYHLCRKENLCFIYVF
jgi:hypothetical protein